MGWHKFMFIPTYVGKFGSQSRELELYIITNGHLTYFARPFRDRRAEIVLSSNLHATPETLQELERP